MTPAELRAQRARIVTNAKSKLDEITASTTEARAAEIETEFDAMMIEAEGLEARAARQDRLARAEASLGAGDDRRPNGDLDQRGAAPAVDALTYRSAFHQLMMVGGDHYALSNEARAAIAAHNVELRAQIAGTEAAGGAMVPDEMMQSIVMAMAAWGPMYDDAFATVIKTAGGGSMPIPGVDNTAKRAAKEAAEGAAFPNTGAKDRVFTKDTLEDHLYQTEWLKISIQLATGGMENMESLFGGLLGEELGRTANDVLTIGTGAGQPLGVVTGASLGHTPAAAGSFTGDDILALIHSVDPAYRQSPKFGLMFNDTTLLAMHKLKDGDGRYLLSEAPDGSGRIKVGAVSAKYTVNQAMANVGANARAMIAGDMSKYYVRKIGNTVIHTDRGAQFLPGFGMAGFARMDGTVADARAIKAMVQPAA
jgi:HK97 family phage major capsid protein